MIQNDSNTADWTNPSRAGNTQATEKKIGEAALMTQKSHSDFHREDTESRIHK